jgi:16S rRNA (adenine1518-N6/adenine1519-N6)-dimethyltransferase
MVMMFQSEVAQRLYAKAGEKKRGSLSVWVQNRWEVKKFLSVSPSAFRPAPKVYSEIVVLTRRESPFVPVQLSEERWESLLKQCFSHRRKMLRSNIPWPLVLEEAGVDGTKRAEELQWDEWNRLFFSVLKKEQ